MQTFSFLVLKQLQLSSAGKTIAWTTKLIAVHFFLKTEQSTCVLKTTTMTARKKNQNKWRKRKKKTNGEENNKRKKWGWIKKKQ